jgi:ATP-dependent DNA helicase PIF1
MFETPKSYEDEITKRIDSITLSKVKHTEEHFPKEKSLQRLPLLNAEQQAVLEEVKQGRNVFITGPGGTGKSFLIREMKRQLEKEGKKVAITALTGMAALLIGGNARTIHSWSGIGTGTRSVQEMHEFIRKCQPKVREAWRTTHTLIIDEISMMSDVLFEKLDELGRLMRWKPDRSFGGIQLICLGDFYQLPPINTKFVFESSLWDTTIETIVVLDTIYRQKDPVFQKILNEIRIGKVSDETDTILKTRLNLDFTAEAIRPTKIFTRRDMVDYVNKEELAKLITETYTYGVSTKGKASTEAIKNAIKRLDSSAPYVEELKLKVGAQVMLITNLDQEAGLVNGKVGIVKDCKTSSVFVTFKGDDYPIEIKSYEWPVEGYETIVRKQIPLILAYAITTHKSQGATLESAYIDVGPSVFEYGQAYVALSRVKNLNALYLHDYDRKAIRAHPKVIEYYNSLEVEV